MTSDNSYHMNYICMDMKNIFSLVARLIYLMNLYLNGIPSTIFVRENLGWAKSLGVNSKRTANYNFRKRTKKK